MKGNASLLCITQRSAQAGSTHTHGRAPGRRLRLCTIMWLGLRVPVHAPNRFPCKDAKHWSGHKQGPCVRMVARHVGFAQHTLRMGGIL